MNSDYKFEQRDFEHPSIIFILEEELKNVFGCFIYNPYFRSFGLKGNESVLDFGCGGGSLSKCLAKLLKKDGSLTCIDTSSYWIRKAIKRLKKYPNVKCLLGDIRSADLPASSFDAISTIHVIHDIVPEVREETVNILSQKLKQDGTFFLRERIQKSHGMPVSEIQSLLLHAGLKEVCYSQTKSEYIGKYQKAG